MVRMQHRDRREGGITVGDPPTRYLLDSEGTVEVAEEHAKMLAGTGMWAPPGTWPAPPAAAPPALPGVGRAPRTRAELEAAARAEGLMAPEAPPGPEDTIGLNAGVMADHPEPTPVMAPPSDTIEVSADMTLEELRGVAQQLGLTVPKRISQSALFELIRAQGEQAP